MYGGDKDVTKVKQTTKIKQKYNAPVQDVNIPMSTIITPNNPQQTNLPINQTYSQGSGFVTQGPAVSSVPIGGTNLTRKRNSSSSSGSSQGVKNAGEIRGNVNQFGQPSTLNQPTTIPTGNIQTGYGPSTGFDPNFGGNTVSGQTTYTGSTGPLGKNLYGETGYATQMHQLQEPFPGQTVYVEKPKQKISQKTKEKFQKPVI